jgi:hypothetical protein
MSEYTQETVPTQFVEADGVQQVALDHPELVQRLVPLGTGPRRGVSDCIPWPRFRKPEESPQPSFQIFSSTPRIASSS